MRKVGGAKQHLIELRHVGHNPTADIGSEAGTAEKRLFKGLNSTYVPGAHISREILAVFKHGLHSQDVFSVPGSQILLVE